MSGIVTALVALVAVLGTMVFFLFPNSILNERVFVSNDKSDISQTTTPIPAAPKEIPEDTPIVAEQPQPLQPTQPTPTPETEQPYSMADECKSLGIDAANCTENAILAAKRLAAYQNQGSSAIQISNAHIWVGSNATGTPNPDSVAGFVVQNTGSGVATIQSITVRGQSIPINQWYYNDTQSVAAANTQKELVWESNFNLNDGYDLRSSTAGQEALTKATGPISLAPGQAAFIFLDSPAGINSMDMGLAFTINISAGKASAVQSVSAISAG